MSKPKLTVSVFSDYICPFCYIGSVRLDRLRADFALNIDWVFLEIHPDNPPAGRPVEALGYPPKQWQQMMAALNRMAEEEGVHIAERTFTTNSRKALLLAEAVKTHGAELFYVFHNRLFQAYFGERRNIGDDTVLRDLAHQSGVPAETVENAWTEQRYEQRLHANHVRAARLGVNATPAFLIGQRILLGVVPTAVLHEAACAVSTPGLSRDDGVTLHPYSVPASTGGTDP